MLFGEHSLARLMRISKRALDACADDGDEGALSSAPPVSLAQVIDDIITPGAIAEDLLDGDPEKAYAHLAPNADMAVDVDGALDIDLILEALPACADPAGEAWL